MHLLDVPTDLLELHLLPFISLLPTPSIRSLACTCSSLCALLRPVLFKTLNVRRDFNLLARADLVLTTPSLFQHVRTLSLLPPPTNRFFIYPPTDSYGLDSAYYATLERAIATVLPHTRRLVVLSSLPSVRLLRYMLEWSRSPELREVVVSGVSGAECMSELLDLGEEGRRNLRFTPVAARLEGRTIKGDAREG